MKGPPQRRSTVAFIFTLLAVATTTQLVGQTVLSGTYPANTTIFDDVVINANTTATFVGNSTFTGTVGTWNSNSGLYWQQTGTLNGKALGLASGSFIYVNGANNTLTLGPGTTVTGSGSIYSDGSAGTAITNQGSIILSGSGSGQYHAISFTNDGTITANSGTHFIGYPSASYATTNSATGTITSDGSGTQLYVRGPVDNNGTITAQNTGQIIFQGTTTSANLGNVQIASGGRVLLNGTIDNTAANLTAPTGGTYELYGGIITGGTIASGALTFTSSGGYLDGASLTGNLTLPTGTYVRFQNGAGFTGPTATLNNSSGVYWGQTGTLTGTALNFSSGAYLYVNGTGSTLTLAPTTTASGDVSIYSDGSAGTAITNQGVITHTGSSGQLYATNFTNDGTITANAGTLYIGYPSASYAATNSASGVITSNGSGTTVYLRGPVDNNGTINAQNSGQVIWQGTTTTANLGIVQLATGGRALFNGTIDNTAANLVAPVGGAYELYGGTIQGGTIATGALTFTSSGGYLDGASLTGDFTMPTNTYVRFINGGGFTGANATWGNNAGAYWQQVGTLTGKALDFGTGAYLYVAGVNNTLTLAPSTTATGNVSIYTDGSAGTTITNQGVITHTTSTGSIYGINVVNDGSITASAGSTLYIGYPSASYVTTNSATGSITSTGASTNVYLRGPVDNNGMVTAQNSGTIIYQGTTTTANLGNVQLATGGRALFNGTIDNTAANLVAPTGGLYELYGGTIQGGTIAAGALSFTNTGGYLDGATLSDNLNLPANTYLRFIGGGAFTGANATFGSNSGVYWQQAGNLAGKALNFGNGSYLYVAGTNNTLTLAPGTTATGTVSIYSDGSTGTAITNQGAITHTTGSGSIYAINLVNDGSILANNGTTLYIGYPSASYVTTISATGTITSDGTGTDLYLRGPVDNNGTVTAQNSGSVTFQGTTTTANLGNIQIASGGHVRLNGTIDNTATTLNPPSGGAYELYGGTIQGGTIASGALTFTSAGGYLDNSTLTGNLAVPASTYMRFINNAGFTGTSATLGTNAGVYWQQVGTLTGRGVNFGSGAYWYVAGANNSLTLDSGTTATGSVSIYSDGSAGTTITNQGTISHTTGSGQVYAINFNNAGAITASSGTFYLGYPSAGYTSVNGATGTITSTGGTTQLLLRGPFTNNGVIQAQAGTIYTGNSLTNGATGTIKGAGTFNGNLAFAGGTLAPGNSIGTLTHSSGSFSVTGSTTFAVELSGATADQLLFVNPLTIDIGNGLMNLNLTLLGAPTPGAVYDLMRINVGAGTITGTFAGLPNSGDYLTANYLGTDYSFFVTYLSNKITLSVPEPGTYALMSAGLALLGLRRWRSRRKA